MAASGLRIEPGLHEAVDGYLRRGFFVSGLTPTSARLVKPKRFNVSAAILWLLFFGAGLFDYLIYFAASRDEVVDMRLGADGSVQIQRLGPTPGETALGVAVIVVGGLLLLALVIAVFALV